MCIYLNTVIIISTITFLDLGIDDDYFHYSYVNHSLTIEMDSLPDDLLTNLTVIPLKLSITDRSTQDTVHAVLNVNIGSGKYQEVDLVIAC